MASAPLGHASPPPAAYAVLPPALCPRCRRPQAPKPSSGPHKTRECLPLILLLRNRLKYALTGKEVTSILMQRLVEVDGKVRTDKTYPVGFMDVVDIPKTGESGATWLVLAVCMQAGWQGVMRVGVGVWLQPAWRCAVLHVHVCVHAWSAAACNLVQGEGQQQRRRQWERAALQQQRHEARPAGLGLAAALECSRLAGGEHGDNGRKQAGFQQQCGMQRSRIGIAPAAMQQQPQQQQQQGVGSTGCRQRAQPEAAAAAPQAAG